MSLESRITDLNTPSIQEGMRTVENVGEMTQNRQDYSKNKSQQGTVQAVKYHQDLINQQDASYKGRVINTYSG